MSDIEDRPAPATPPATPASPAESESAAAATSDANPGSTPLTDSGAPKPQAVTPPSADQEANPDTQAIAKQTDPETPAPSNSAEPDSQQSVQPEQPATSNPETSTPPASVSLRLRLVNFASMPIAGLAVRLEINSLGRTVVTDALGNCPVQEDLIPGSTLEVFVQKEDGQWVSKYAATIASGDMHILGVSPSIKIPVTTEPHVGTVPAPKPTAPSKPPTPPKPPQPNAPPKDTPKTGGTVPACVTAESRRDSGGHPVARVREVLVDWAGRHGIPTFGLWSWSDFKQSSGPVTPMACTPAPSASPTAKPPATAAPASAPAAQTAISGNSKSPAPALPQPRTSAIAGTKSRINSLTQTPPSELTHLLEIMEEQTLWHWKKAPLNQPSEGIVAALLTKSLGEPEQKSATVSVGACYKSVKVGLKRANYVAAMNGDIPAMTAGPWLLQQGFREVTNELPDARWAWPGDVIVYKYPASKEAANDAKSQAELEKKLAKYEQDNAAYLEKKKTYDLQKADFESTKALWLKDNPKKSYPKQFTIKAPTAPKKPVFEGQNYGHIDVRSYDAYLSDFRSASNSLPDATQFEVTGIYRKVSDPLPEIRLKAFLKILREWENHSEPNDENRYFKLSERQPIEGSLVFTDTTKHPYEKVDNPKSTAAGAYQILLPVYRLLLAERFGFKPGFSPIQQDRLAVLLIEQQKGNPLSLIRSGKIKEAVEILNSTWFCLPGTKQTRQETRDGANYKFTISDLLAQHEKFMKDIISK